MGSWIRADAIVEVEKFYLFCYAHGSVLAITFNEIILCLQLIQERQLSVTDESKQA